VEKATQLIARLREVARVALLLAPFALAVFAAIGFVLLFTLLSWPLLLVPLGVLGVVVVLRLGTPKVGRWLGAPVVAVLALLGIDYVWALVGGGRPAPLIGLVVAGAIVFAGVIVYMQSWLAAVPVRHAWIPGLVVAVLLVGVPPVAVGSWKLFHDTRPLPTKQQPVSQLDVVVVSGLPTPPQIDPSVKARGWQINFWVGAAKGRAVRWSGAGPPQLREEADHVLLLLVDGSPARLDDAAKLPDLPARRGEVKRWLAIADQAAARDTPTFAVLQTKDKTRLRGWERRLPPTDENHRDGGRHGEVFSLQSLAGPRAVGDLGLRLGVDAAGADEDLALAARYRPALFFASSEKHAIPLNVDRLFNGGIFRLCSDHQFLFSSCREIDDAGDLENGPNHLSFETDQLASLSDDSTIYVHVAHHQQQDGERVFLDYWWYLADNPSNGAEGAFCGAGFVIAEVTCFDHQSDWEGVTVVVDPKSELPSPIEVHYAQHKGATRYTWPALVALWSEHLSRQFAAKVNTTLHPLVFSASGTHASYPTVCRQKHCTEPKIGLKENRHDGGKPWQGNDDDICGSICLNALPTDRRGTRPARWNAYEGHWGTTRCNLLFFCSSTDAPLSPARQSRYRAPWCTNRTVSFGGGRLRFSNKRVCT
jgi:hypothetical protein